VHPAKTVIGSMFATIEVKGNVDHRLVQKWDQR
jgi:hypothetical protein